MLVCYLTYLVLNWQLHLALLLCSSRPDASGVDCIVDFALFLAKELLFDLDDVVVVTVHLNELLVDQGVNPGSVLIGLLHLYLGCLDAHISRLLVLHRYLVSDFLGHVVGALLLEDLLLSMGALTLYAILLIHLIEVNLCL